MRAKYDVFSQLARMRMRLLGRVARYACALYRARFMALVS